MRIIAGQWRGRRLASLGKGDEGAHLRPTGDRVRESIFSILEGGRFGDPIVGAKVLDLFAGTGALGLEALSRGAGTCVFVDNGRTARRLLADNITALAAENTRTLHMDARRMTASDYAANLVFLDPPYGKGYGDEALRSAGQQGWIAADALVVLEDNAPAIAPEGFTLLETRRFGDTHVTFLRHDA